MRHTTLKEEKKLWSRGYRVVAGVDEVGRGPLAGPVLACAVVLFPKSDLVLKTKSDLGSGSLRDSKQLSAKQREEFYGVLVNHPSLAWGVGRVYPSVIDRINIFQATKLAMKRAVLNLQKKLNTLCIEFLVVDGTMRLDVSIPQKAIIKADEKVFSCAAASIIAKVKRDRLMLQYHKQYSQYGFDKHKGYGTKLHIDALREHGLSLIHRKSFIPCKTAVSLIQYS